MTSTVAKHRSYKIKNNPSYHQRDQAENLEQNNNIENTPIRSRNPQ